MTDLLGAEEICTLVESISCPPYRVQAALRRDGCVSILTSREAVDVRTGASGVFQQCRMLPEGKSREMILGVVLSLLENMACHEVHEQFRVGEERPFAPHTPSPLPSR